MAWLVKLLETPKVNDFGYGYFPRKFHYKKDAQEFVRKAMKRGIKIVMEKNDSVKGRNEHSTQSV